MSFWDDLYAKKKLVVGLSPMDGVTDSAMRYMSAKYGEPDILLTEFVSVDALAHAKEEKAVDRVMRAFVRAKDVGQLDREPFEIAQVFGHTPELFYQAAVMIAELGYDGMDINMGCPMHKIEDQGSGAGLIRTPEVAQEIILASKRAMEDFSQGKVKLEDLKISDNIKKWVTKHRKDTNKVRESLPVSVKTRVGVDKIVVEEWMSTLMQVKPDNISLHGRTLRQLYQGFADWEAIGRAAQVVHELGGHIIGNGDVLNLEDARRKVDKYNVDGVLIGRNAEGNPGIFKNTQEPSSKQRIEWMIEHAKLYEKIFKYSGNSVIHSSSESRENDNRWFMPMRKHLAWYCKGFEGAVEIRTKLMQTNSADEVEEIVENLSL